jgi:hypothetical protein
MDKTKYKRLRALEAQTQTANPKQAAFLAYKIIALKSQIFKK